MMMLEKGYFQYFSLITLLYQKTSVAMDVVGQNKINDFVFSSLCVHENIPFNQRIEIHTKKEDSL